MASDSSDGPDAPDRSGELAPNVRDLMPVRPAKWGAAYQDVLDAPLHKIAEVVDGALYISPMPPPLHAWAATRLGGRLGGAFDLDRGGPGGWRMLNKPELHLGDDIVVPKLAGWRRENMPEIPDVAYFSQAPDWVCEVISPYTQALDEGAKKAIYAREGVTHLWHVDPLARWLAAYALRGGRYALLRKLTGDDPVSLPPFDAIEFSLGHLWPSPPNP